MGPCGGGLYPQSFPTQGHLERAHIVLNFVPELQFGHPGHPRIPQAQCTQVAQSSELQKHHGVAAITPPLELGAAAGILGAPILCLTSPLHRKEAQIRSGITYLFDIRVFFFFNLHSKIRV